jgi:hypothetical protein
MSFEDLYFRPTEESREIFRNLRFVLAKLGVWTSNNPIMREHTHRFCLKYAQKFHIKG